MPADANSKPQPISFQKLDRAHKIVNLKLMVIGSNAHSFVERVHRATNPNPQLQAPSSLPTYDYLSLRMGDIRGYQTFMHIFGKVVSIRKPAKSELTSSSQCAIRTTNRNDRDKDLIGLVKQTVEAARALSPRHTVAVEAYRVFRYFTE